MIVTMRNPLLDRLAGDEALAARARAGDDVAFAALVRRMQPRLTAYCAAILGNAQDADDAVQNALIKALAALRRDDAVDAVRPWLFRIAHNEAISLMRRRRPVSELAATVEDHAHGPAETVAVREEVRAVLSAIGELPDRSRDALLLREVGGMRHAEVAAVLGTSPGNARQAVFEARVALQDDRAGRDATCQAIREAISVRERRRASRAVRGHLRACTSCQAWSEAQTRRRRVLGVAPGAGLPIAGGLWSWLGGLFGGSAASGGATVKVVASVAAVAAAAPVGVGTLERELRRKDAERTVAEAPVRTATVRTPAPASEQRAAPTTPGSAVAPSASAPAAAPPGSSFVERTPAATWSGEAPEVTEVEEPRRRSESLVRTPRRTVAPAPVTNAVELPQPRVSAPRAAGHRRMTRRDLVEDDDRDLPLDREKPIVPAETQAEEAPEPTATTPEEGPPAVTTPTSPTEPAPAPDLEPDPDDVVTTAAG